ncbi:MAG: SAM-dependent methyltransferase [Bacteroidaceae bacterium]|nr:SAM-dependent methyltransferase [Bacteroidaceae bacterium]
MELTSALYLIPCPVGDTPVEQVLPPHNADVVRALRHFAVEEVRTARRFLKRVDRTIDIDALTFYPIGKHADEAAFSAYLDPLRRGESVGVISEAGCPAVADPGAALVEIAQREGLRVVPLVGPSSLLMAVMASGLNGQSFAFNGYLPIDGGARAKRIRTLESRARQERQTQLFIETPYRNARLFKDLLAACSPQTRLCVAAGLTTPQEYVRTRTVRQWRAHPLPDLAKVPAVFLIL